MTQVAVTVERHKRGWAVVEQIKSGYLAGQRTVLSVHRTKADAEKEAYGE